MAAVEITSVIPPTPNPDEDSWLYGGSGDKDPAQSTLDVNAAEFVSKVQNGNDQNGDGDSASESDSDDEDDIQITIGEINKNAPPAFGGGPFVGAPSTQTQPKVVTVITVQPPAITNTTLPLTTTCKRTIDVNAVGSINGVPIYDYDIDTMCEDKPWRMPGADLTDYFNYGFNEDSWKVYCNKQKGVRGVAAETTKETVRNVTLPELPKFPGQGTIGVLGARKDHQLPHPPPPMISTASVTPRLLLPQSLGNVLFPPTALPQPAFLPLPQLAPPGLAPLLDNIHIKQEDGGRGSMMIPSSNPLHPSRGGGPLPPPMFIPSMLPPPSNIPPMMLPPPTLSEEEASSEEDRRRASSRRSPRKRRSSHHRRTSRSHRSPRKDKKSRKSSRERSHRHRDEERSKRNRRKKEENGEEAENEGAAD